MPMYEFKHDESGDLWLEFYDCNEVPSIGQTITRDGREWTRVFCGHCGLKRTNTKALGYPFVSESLPRDCDLGVPRDKKGRQIIKSKKAERQALAAMEGECGRAWVRD